MDQPFRPILPMRRPDDDDKNPPPPQTAVPKKRKVISQACLSRGKDCIYEFEEGRPDVATLRSEIRLLKEQASKSQPTNPTPAFDAPAQSQTLPDASSAATLLSRSLTSIRGSFPTNSATQEAVDNFFASSCQLFHLFSRHQASLLKESIWDDTNSDSQSRKADICCLMAVAAAGAQYSDTSYDTNTSAAFYGIAKFYLDDILEERPLDAIKVCALLCHYNVTDNINASLAYADIGLGLCRRYGLYDQHRGPSTSTGSDWANYRTAWRTLLFMSTCLSATVACKYGRQDTFYRISPSEITVDDASDVSDIIQTEMARIAALKARVLYTHVVCKDFSWSIDTIISDLEGWYESIPKVMRLQDISARSLPSEIKQTMFLVHLFYFSSSILIFRRTTSETLQSPVNDPSASWQPFQDQHSIPTEDRALLAASGSARTIKMMLDENRVFKRSWLIILSSFQSYTSCLILLHSTARKMISSTQPSVCEAEFSDIRLCLGALQFCSSESPIAARFYGTLSSIYEKLLKEHEIQLVSTAIHSSGAQRHDAPPSHNLDGSLEELSSDLLAMLCQPFGGLGNRMDSKECINVNYNSSPSWMEYQHLMEKLDWEFEDSDPFQWGS
ncbi:hypothetical protein F5Y08DRAFT_332049 [Xylaria arbuscula]|nr:hypothetical protein F5Y08DRAFT_332049 [Xylaria arbuscula]